MITKTKNLRLALAAVLAVAGLSAATTLAVGGITGTGSSSSTTSQSVGGGSTPVHTLGVTDFTLSVSDGDKGESLPFLSSVIRNSNGTVNANHNVTVTLTRPDSSSTYFVQKTDNDGRLRGHITGDNLTQVGSYNLSAHVWSGKTASDTFSIREKLFKDLDDQVVTGRRQHFRNRTNDTNAFSIEDASGDSLFSVDTILKQITVGDLRPKETGALVTGLSVNTIDSNQYIGYYGGGMALGSDGFARLIFGDDNNSLNNFTLCQNADCTDRATTQIPLSDYDAYYPIMVMGPDGFPRIIFNDQNDYNMRVARCTDAACTNPVITTVDASGSDQYKPSAVIGPDGFLRIAFVGYDNDLGNATVYIRCQDADCSTRVTTVIDDNYAYYDSVALSLGSDGFARIAYVGGNTNNYPLNFARCTDANCTTPIITTLDDNSANNYPGNYGVNVAMAPDDFPRIFHGDSDSDYSYFFEQCLDVDCASKATNFISKGDGYYGGVGLAVGSNGLAWLSFEDDADQLRAVRCADAACSSKAADVLVDATPYAASTVNVLRLGSDGLPRLAYGDGNYYGDGIGEKFAVFGSDTGQDFSSGTAIGSPDARFGQISNTLLNTNRVEIQGSQQVPFSIKDANGATIFSINNTGGLSFQNQIALQSLSQKTAAESLVVSRNFNTAWTSGSDWVRQTYQLDHNAGSPSTMSPLTPPTITPGQKYIVYIVGYSSAGSLDVGLGGTVVSNAFNANSEYPMSVLVTATNSGTLELIPSPDFQASIYEIGVYPVVDTLADLLLKDASGNASLEVRTGTADAQNIFLGIGSGQNTTSGGTNVGIGGYTLNHNVNGSGNIALGDYALQGVVSGSQNIGIGYAALESLKDSQSNIAIGNQTAYAMTSGYANVIIGNLAGYQMSSGNYNIVIGDHVSAIGSYNIAIGADVNGNNKIAIGNMINGDMVNQTLQLNSASVTITGRTTIQNGIVVVNSEPAKEGAIIRAAFGQTANLLEIQGNDASVLAKIDKDGNITVKSLTVTGNFLTLSSNVRGINIALGSGVTTKAITFGTAHADANYLVDCTPTWNTTCFVTNKTTSGFTLNFGTATPDANQKVDWLVVR